ncbi:hypothetical protein O9929_15680 [Vibrio lentus]|nr:hypothetical protein [Vibrio lentus]
MRDANLEQAARLPSRATLKLGSKCVLRLNVFMLR